MTTLALPRRSVKTTRRTPTPSALARALDAALRKLRGLMPAYHHHPAKSAARGRWLERVWWPANAAADRAENAVLAHLRRRGVLGMVVDGRLYLNLTDALDDLTEYRPMGVLVVNLEDIPGLEVGPDPADDQWHAEQSPDHHFDGPTPLEVLDAPATEPDWDALAEESAAVDRLCRGVLVA